MAGPEGTRLHLALPGMALPAGSALRRDLPPQLAPFAGRPEVTGPYDRRTLVYAAIALPARGELRLYGPRLLNLSGLVAGGQFALDGVPLRLRRRIRHRRFECHVLRLPPGVRGGRLTLQAPGLVAEMPVHAADPASFAGRNVLYTMQRNNDLDWVRDWVRWHVARQGADAVVVADNGSDAYSPQALAEALALVPGIRASAVVEAPFPFGPRSGEAPSGKARFLQAAMMNLVRDLLLTPARAVLSLDIDELVVSRGAVTAFDAAVRSWLGLALIPGHWRYCDPVAGRPSHAGSVLRPPGDDACPPKYAVVPGRWLGRTAWSVHSLILAPREVVHTRRDLWFAHCHDVSTNWSGQRMLPEARPGWARDEGLAAALAQVFGPVSPPAGAAPADRGHSPAAP